ncbi:hypothetical protein MANY_22300 [Mycolicibacterium anyangense]|uniref:ESX-1 secretion-associated protein n=1 Tax=Mycolicibacterium anyangense TaxID=1431246 RepID=A0A6N4W968_9MYCO|nr:hypothetical protein MANY_22300 [Mycolicibacterium anyangense]
MGKLDVDPAGLEALAASCQGWSAELSTTVSPGAGESSCQASVTAVAIVHTQASAFGAACSVRMESTGARLTGASANYTQHEQHSASNLTI